MSKHDTGSQRSYPVEDEMVNDNHEPVEEQQQEQQQPAVAYGDHGDDHESGADSEVEEIPVSKDMGLAPTHMHGFTTMMFYNVFFFISFVFMLTSSTTIPWLGAGNSRKWGIWKEYGAGGPVLKVNDITDCTNERQYWQAMAAFAIIGCIASLATFISSMLLTFGKGHIGVTLVLGFYSMVASLLCWALCVTQYHFFRCGKGVFVNHINRLHAGFCLTFISWALTLVGEFILMVHFLGVYEPNRSSAVSHPMRILFMLITFATLLLCIVGCAFTMWEKDFSAAETGSDVVRVKVTLWHTEVMDLNIGHSLIMGSKHYGCSDYAKRMKGAMAMIFIAIALLFFTFISSVIGVYTPSQRIVSGAISVGAIVFMFIFWVIMVVTRHRGVCKGDLPAGAVTWFGALNGVPTGYANVHVNWKGYTITEGLGMIIAAWCIQIVATIGNFIYVAEEPKKVEE